MKAAEFVGEGEGWGFGFQEHTFDLFMARIVSRLSAVGTVSELGLNSLIYRRGRGLQILLPLRNDSVGIMILYTD